MKQSKFNRENWIKSGSSRQVAMSNKETVEKLKQDKELQKRINKFKVL